MTTGHQFKHFLRASWPWLLIWPTVIYLMLFFFFPISRLLIESIDGGTFEAYTRVATQRIYWIVILLTLEIAFYVTLIDFILGYPVALFLARARSRAQLIGLLIVLLPFWMSTLVRTYAWMIILGRRGILNETLVTLGLASEPLRMLSTTGAVVLGMAHLMLPFMILPIYNSLRQIDPNLEVAAAGLGASPWRVLTSIQLPLSVHGIGAGVTLVFVISLGFFVTPALLGGGKVPMIALIMEQQVRTFLDWSLAGALSVVLLTLVLAALGLLALLLRRLGGTRPQASP